WDPQQILTTTSAIKSCHEAHRYERSVKVSATMKQAVTGEQISKWFTSGTAFTTLNLKEETKTEYRTPTESR
ncbi:hypothetical protein ILYODFUR_032347, partial [Ilyodon furcidens]